MNLFVPFNINTWNSSSFLPQYLALSGYGVLGAAVLIVSQFCLRPLLNFNRMNVKKFLLWFMLEVFVLSAVMYLFYGNDRTTGWELYRELGLSIQYTGLVITLPYTIVLLCLHVQKQQERIKTFAHLKKRESTMERTQAVAITDENEKPVLTVSLNSLLFLKSEDNYGQHGPAYRRKQKEKGIRDLVEGPRLPVHPRFGRLQEAL